MRRGRWRESGARSRKAVGSFHVYSFVYLCTIRATRNFDIFLDAEFVNVLLEDICDLSAEGMLVSSGSKCTYQTDWFQNVNLALLFTGGNLDHSCVIELGLLL